MRKAQHILGLLFVVMALASCGGDDATAYDYSSHEVTVSFTMSLGSPQAATRARNIDWTAYDSIPGAGMENRVDLTTLQVYFYDTAGNYFGRAENLTLQRQDSTTYNVTGVMRVDTLTLAAGNRFSGKMVVYANTGAAVAQGVALADDAIGSLSYGYVPGTAPSAIPMWGVKTVSDADFTPGHRTDLSDIWLLRAMAKVDVGLTDDMAARGYRLTRVVLSGYNTQGYVLPKGYGSVGDTRILNYDSGEALSFNPFPSATADSVTFTGRTLYVPEYDNSVPARITVTIGHPDGTERTASFDFARYTGGSRSGSMNIVRNHAYVFSVYGDPIKIELKVLPWTVFRHSEIVL